MKVRVSPRPFLLFKSPLIMAENLAADLFFITNFTFLLTQLDMDFKGLFLKDTTMCFYKTQI